MSNNNFMVATMRKFKQENLGGIEIHNERKTKNHSNKDIDVDKKSLNLDLINETGSYRKRISDRIMRNRKSDRKVRKDAVILAEWVVSASPEVFEKMSGENIKLYFGWAVRYFADKFGSENIVYAKIHFDEPTPHMHLGMVPLTKDGRLSAKDVFDRSALRAVQSELPVFLKGKGFDVRRGQKNDERKKLTVPEYKKMKEDIAELIQQGKYLEKRNTELKSVYNQEISRITNTINSVLKENDVIPVEDEPVYFYDGLQRPIFLGSIRHFLGAETESIAQALRPPRKILKNVTFISNGDMTPVNNVKSFKLSASEVLQDVREQLIRCIDRWKKSLRRYLKSPIDKTFIGRAKIKTEVAEWVDPTHGGGYVKGTFVEGNFLGETNRFLYINPKISELKNVLSPTGEYDRCLGSLGKVNRPRATFLQNSSVTKANELLKNFDTPERAREIAKFYKPRVPKESPQKGIVRR